jgi:hypothetical protein
MQATAQYIEELSDQLSNLARQHEMHDLAYLLRLASDEARANAQRAAALVRVPAYEGLSQHG